MSNITIKSAIEWFFGGLFQNSILWLFYLVFGIAFSAVVFGALWVFDKHNAMNPKKKKYFFIGLSLLATLFIGTAFTLCAFMSSAAKHFDQQTEDMRMAAIGRENRGITAGVIACSKSVQEISTNYDASLVTGSGISSAPANRTMQSGAEAVFVLRISNSGMPTTLWNYKAYINIHGQDGKDHEMDASIPSIVAKTNNVMQTIVGPINLTKEDFLLDALSFKPIETGAAGYYWLVIHINGIPEIPVGTHVFISFTDALGREIKVDYPWTPGI